MANKREYRVGLVITTNGKEGARGIRGTREELDKFKKSADGSKSAVGGLSTSFGGLTRLLPSVTSLIAGIGFVSMVRSTVEAAESLDKMTAKLGISAEALSELRYVAELSSVPVATLEMGLQRMTRRLGEVAALGRGEAKVALDALGLSAEALVELPLDRQFEEIAEALSQVENEAKRTALAAKIFDSEGIRLVQTMRDGAAGIRELRAEGREFGVTVSQEMATAAADFTDEMGRVGARTQGVANVIVAELLPSLTELLRAFNGLGSPAKALSALIADTRAEFATLTSWAYDAAAAIWDLWGAFKNLVRDTEGAEFAESMANEARRLADVAGDMANEYRDSADAVDAFTEALGGTPTGGGGGGGGGGGAKKAAKEAKDAFVEVMSALENQRRALTWTADEIFRLSHVGVRSVAYELGSALPALDFIRNVLQAR